MQQLLSARRQRLDMAQQTEAMSNEPTSDSVAVNTEMSRCWCIQYGPEPYDCEADSIADIIEAALKKVMKQKTTSQIVAEVYVVEIESEDAGIMLGWYDVIALVNVDEQVSKVALSDRIIAATKSTHRDVISKEFRFKALDESQFEQLRKECLHPSWPDVIRRTSRLW